MGTEQLNELLYQALETELGGIEIYTMAVSCAVNPDLKTARPHLAPRRLRVPRWCDGRAVRSHAGGCCAIGNESLLADAHKPRP